MINNLLSLIGEIAERYIVVSILDVQLQRPCVDRFHLFHALQRVRYVGVRQPEVAKELHLNLDIGRVRFDRHADVLKNLIVIVAERLRNEPHELYEKVDSECLDWWSSILVNFSLQVAISSISSTLSNRQQVHKTHHMLQIHRAEILDEELVE